MGERPPLLLARAVHAAGFPSVVRKLQEPVKRDRAKLDQARLRAQSLCLTDGKGKDGHGHSRSSVCAAPAVSADESGFDDSSQKSVRVRTHLMRSVHPDRQSRLKLGGAVSSGVAPDRFRKSSWVAPPRDPGFFASRQDATCPAEAGADCALGGNCPRLRN